MRNSFLVLLDIYVDLNEKEKVTGNDKELSTVLTVNMPPVSNVTDNTSMICSRRQNGYESD